MKSDEKRGSDSTRSLILVLTVILITIMSCGCTTHELGSSHNETIQVITTILPLSEFVTSVGGQYVTCRVMIPPGASPHTFEMTPGQMQQISDADLYVMVGSGIEFEDQWMERLQEINPGMKIINASAGLTFLPGSDDHEHEHNQGYDNATIPLPDENGRHDPHVWLSLTNAITMVNEISSGLSKADPSHGSFYEGNRDIYTSRMQYIDQQIKEMMTNTTVSAVMVTHPSFQYFCRDYGIRQISIEEDGKEPTPGHLKDLVQTARENDIRVIFVEPEYSDAGAQAVAKEIGAKIIQVDPLPEKYLQNMNLIAEAFSGNNDVSVK